MFHLCEIVCFICCMKHLPLRESDGARISRHYEEQNKHVQEEMKQDVKDVIE